MGMVDRLNALPGWPGRVTPKPGPDPPAAVAAAAACGNFSNLAAL